MSLAIVTKKHINKEKEGGFFLPVAELPQKELRSIFNLELLINAPTNVPSSIEFLT